MKILRKQIRFATVTIFAIGIAFAFLVVFGRFLVTNNQVPPLIGKDDAIGILTKGFGGLRFNSTAVELLHVNNFGQVFVVDQTTLWNSYQYQGEVASGQIHRGEYLWLVPVLNQGGCMSQDYFLVDASIGTPNYNRSTDCPLTDQALTFQNGTSVEFPVFKERMAPDGTISYPGIRQPNQNVYGYSLLNSANSLPEVRKFLEKYHDVYVQVRLIFNQHEVKEMPKDKYVVTYAVSREISGGFTRFYLEEAFNSTGYPDNTVISCGSGLSHMSIDPDADQIHTCYDMVPP